MASVVPPGAAAGSLLSPFAIPPYVIPLLGYWLAPPEVLPFNMKAGLAKVAGLEPPAAIEGGY
jgi:hypothetical protein